MFLQLRAQVAYANGAENIVHHTFDLQGGTIGRDSHCQMVLQDPFRRISRIQAQIVFDEGQFTLINASTSNPIYVDDQELSPGATCAIQNGSTWQAGNYTIVVEHIGAAPFAQVSQSCAQSMPAAQQATNEPAVANTSIKKLDALSTGAGNPFDDLLSTPIEPPHSLIGSQNLLGEPIDTASNLSKPGVDARNWEMTDSPIHNPFAHVAATQPKTPKWLHDASTQGSDPFADLLAEPISHQVADAPPYSPQVAAAHTPSLIPDDFNPLAFNGVSPRNTPDPLSQVQTQQSIQEMFPARSVDAIFQPSDGNIGELIQDPLSASQHQGLVDSSSKLDPLELFTHHSSETRLDPSTLFREQFGSAQTISDHRVETGAYFRAPRALDPHAPQLPEKEVASPTEPFTSATKAAGTSTENASSISNAPDTTHLQVEPTNDNSLESLFDISSSTSDLGVFGIETDAGSIAAPEVHTEISNETTASKTTSSDLGLVMLQAADSVSHIAPTADGTEPTAATIGHTPPLDVTDNRNIPEPSHLASRALHSLGSIDDNRSQTTQTQAPTPTESHRQNASLYSTDELLNNFKAGAGLNDCRYPENLTPELMFMIGSMLGASVQGCMDLLGSRAAAKQEVRVSVTLINSEANNPLKFLPSGVSALAQIFGPRMPGFQPGPAAITDAFQDLRGHEMAMMAGTQAAVRGLFDRFSPKYLEEQLQAQGRSKSLFTSQRQARLWEMYCSHYEWLKDEMKNQSPTAWGTEFHSAYQAEVFNNSEDKSK